MSNVTYSPNDLKASRRALYLGSFISVAGFSVIIPFFPIYANDLLHPIETPLFVMGIALQIGLITAASKFTQLFLNPAFGELSDAKGRKPLIVIGLMFYSIIMVLYGLMTTFWGFFILRLIQGIATASVWVLGEALVVDLSPEEEVGKSLGSYVLSMLAGTTLGPFVGYGLFLLAENVFGLTEIQAFQMTFFLVALIALFATAFVFVKVQDPKARSLPLVEFVSSTSKSMAIAIAVSPRVLYKIIVSSDYQRDRNSYSIYSMAFINGIGTALLLPIFVLFLEDYYFLDPDTIALTIGIVGFVSLVGAPFGGRMSDQFSRKRIVWVSSMLVGLIMMLMGVSFSGNIFVVLAIFFFLRFLFSVLQPAFRSLQNAIVSEKHRGKEFGIVQASFNFGSVIGPVLGGILYDLFFMQNTVLWGEIVFLGVGYTFVLSGFLAIFGALIIKFGVHSNDRVDTITPVEATFVVT